MNISNLRAFAAVAQSGNITQAAKFLHLSQPAVSGQIRALEVELGGALFERTPTGMKLTRFGEEILVDVEFINARVNSMLARARLIRGEVSGRLRVATIVQPDFLHLGEFMRVMRDRFPLVDVELHHGLSGQAVDKVLSGDVTVGFYIGDIPEPPLSAITLRKIVYVVVAPASWATRIQDASLEDIAALPWISTPKQGSRYHLVKKLFRSRGLKPNNVVEADSESTILSLVAAGVGVALVREEVTRSPEHGAQLAVWDKVRQESQLLFIYHASKVEDLVVRAAISVMTEVANPDIEGQG
ncbi:MAG: LysR family transcriptional regulator [Burkholderiaceae bacterium]|nr:LysR family transcriptional regulator [Burkholderiaceae bacterium]